MDKSSKIYALMQRMTDFCQTVSLLRPSGTLERRVFQDPTLRNLTVPCMGLLRFSLSRLLKNQSVIV